MLVDPNSLILPTEAMSFYSNSQFSRLRDIFARFFRTYNPAARRISADLLRTLWQGELISAIHQYKGQRGRPPKSFWELAMGELPKKLGRGERACVVVGSILLSGGQERSLGQAGLESTPSLSGCADCRVKVEILSSKRR